MKIKTSITLYEELLKEVDRFLGKSGNRSAFFEEAIQGYLAQKAHQMREAKDLEILNQQANALNRQAKDILSYQANLCHAVNSIVSIKAHLTIQNSTGSLSL